MGRKTKKVHKVSQEESQAYSQDKSSRAYTSKVTLIVQVRTYGDFSCI